MNHLMDKLLPVFVGLETERDEYQLIEGRKIMAYCHVYSFYAVSIAMLLSLLYDLYFETLSIGTLLLLFIQQATAAYTFAITRKLNIDIDEVYNYETYKNRLKTLRVKSFKIGLFFGSVMYVWMELIFPHFIGESINLNLKSIVRYIISGIFFGTVMYFAAKSKIIKEYD